METEHQVHDMDSIADTPLEQNVHHGMHGNIAAVLILVDIQEALVGVLNIGGNDGAIHDEDKIVVIVILLIELTHHFPINT